ncbi:MAG TPA: FKBP-type peptidyl-prolyl cis-trans isomerase [Lachnospiraceae bacterium]|nr:FKBP-type peptidyl-prolyl cis-trans isomerase [Lachnospiraceae bacterium]
MKKRLAVVLTALLTVSMLGGCGSEKSDHLKDIKVSKYVTLNSEYTGLPLTVTPKSEVTEDQVNEVAFSSYNSMVTSENGGVKDRAVMDGDSVNIDYAGEKDGVAFEGGTAAAQTLVIGSNSFIDGFESGLVGVMPGETVKLDITFPEGYENTDLAGQAVVFTVTVNFIYPKTTDEMKDEVISVITSGQFNTVQEYMKNCKLYIEDNAEYQYNVGKQDSIITALEGITTYKSIPQVLIDKYTESMTTSLSATAQSYGVDLDTLCNYYFATDSTTYIAEQSAASARQAMVFQYIANQEKLNVSDEELEQSLQDMVVENEMESVEALVGDNDREDFREYFMYQKVIDYIFDNAQVTEPVEQK